MQTPRPEVTMRTLVIFAFVTATAALAQADANHTIAVPSRSLPSACVRLAVVPGDARVMTPTLDAYTSVASCIVRERTRAMKLAPTRASIDQLVLAIEPAIDLLDTAIEVGDLPHQIVALHAKADLYEGLIVRMRTSAGATSIADVDAIVFRWHDQAREANDRVSQLAARDPALARDNPVVASVVRDSESHRASGIATR
jgi:hypothetical protein